jgi:predicted metal-binding membrane protein
VIGALRTRNDQRVYGLAIGAVIVLAWAIVALLGTSEYARYAGHSALVRHDHGAASRTQSARSSHPHYAPGVHDDAGARGERASLPVTLGFGIFVGAWTTMTVAMMLPTALPLVTLFRATVARRPRHEGLVFLLIAGYLSVWVMFGILLYLVDAAIHQVVVALAALVGATGYFLPLALLTAGLYQFTPLKDRCLQECRSPLTFIAGHWRGVAPATEALHMGAWHGVFCLGCCWTLMLVMFVVGAAHLPAMLVLGAVMAAEKSMPWGRRLVAPAGAVLILAALALAVQGSIVGAG